MKLGKIMLRLEVRKILLYSIAFDRYRELELGRENR